MWRFTLAAILAALIHAPALAQDCKGPQRIVFGFAAGGGGDALARAVAERLAARTGRTVIVDNRVGASGNIGSAYVAKAPPDGCTLLLTGNHHNLNTQIFSRAGYESADFAPVIQTTSSPSVLVASPSGPATVQALVAQARANPGKIAYGSSGIGSPNHIAMELLLKEAGVQMVHVPYRGAAPALADTVGNVLPLTVGSATATAPFIASGRLKALAVTTVRRWPTLPDVPTLVEAGYPGAVTVTWNALLAPAATPLAVREKLNAELRAVLHEPAVIEKLAGLGFEAVGGSVADLEAFLKQDEQVSRLLAQNLRLKMD
jgi:tripartite-type tricarboxylate transporter receptor subunit TctC